MSEDEKSVLVDELLPGFEVSSLLHEAKLVTITNPTSNDNDLLNFINSPLFLYIINLLYLTR